MQETTTAMFGSLMSGQAGFSMLEALEARASKQLGEMGINLESVHETYPLVMTNIAIENHHV